MSLQLAKEAFLTKYGEPAPPPQVYFAPGRVNLIGEHTDYNGGYVFPCALDFGTYLVISPNGTERINMATTNFNFTDSISINKMERREKSWTNYPMGVMDQFLNRGFRLRGLDMMFSGTIPNGAGLSSSASIEMVTAVALKHKKETVEVLSKLEDSFKEFETYLT